MWQVMIQSARMHCGLLVKLDLQRGCLRKPCHRCLRLRLLSSRAMQPLLPRRELMRIGGAQHRD